MADRWGLIAGNGRFPFLILEAARSQGIEMIVAAIRGEASSEIEKHALEVHWMGLGQLGKLIDTFKKARIKRAIMAGQVKHTQIFSSTIPDWRMIRMLASLPARNTDSIIGGVARVLGEEGIRLEDSTLLLKPLLPAAGALTRRVPEPDEQADLDYGRAIAREIARLDLGQTIAVCDRAVVAIEAMEGTDATIRRAGTLVNGRRFSVIKVSKPNQDMRFDIPVVGLPTLDAMKQAGATALGLDAGRTLIFDREEFVQRADRSGIAVDIVQPASRPRSEPHA